MLPHGAHSWPYSALLTQSRWGPFPRSAGTAASSQQLSDAAHARQLTKWSRPCCSAAAGPLPEGNDGVQLGKVPMLPRQGAVCYTLLRVQPWTPAPPRPPQLLAMCAHHPSPRVGATRQLAARYTPGNWASGICSQDTKTRGSLACLRGRGDKGWGAKGQGKLQGGMMSCTRT